MQLNVRLRALSSPPLLPILLRRTRSMATAASASSASSPASVVRVWRGDPDSKRAAKQAAITSAPKRRTGLLAVKIGMMPVWDDYGDRHPCTVLQVEECQVTQVKTADVHGFASLQLGMGLRKARNVTKPILGHLAKAGVPPKRSLQEFRVADNALIPLGTALSAMHFVPGQFVDVCGVSKGKGFQGVMKRHNFAGQPASHGNSKSHRAAGSTGQCQDPGKVFKGKKMPGRMGGERVTRDNLYVVKIDRIRNLLYVKGTVPGNNGGVVRVTDARKKPATMPLPFPTYIASAEEEARLPAEIMAPKHAIDPFHYDEN